MRKNKKIQTLLSQTKQTTKIISRRDGYAGNIELKSVSRTRADIATWKNALRAAENIDTPRRTKLINLYKDITLDAHLSSQLELRYNSSLSVPFAIKHNDKFSEELTKTLHAKSWVNQINKIILQTPFYGHSLVEFNWLEDNLSVTLLPRENIVPEKGLLLLKQDDNKGISYRDLREYGIWLLEFGNNDDYGLLNKAVPHCLFKRFAQSCWSELCEIYGIPPRVVKTDMQDPEARSRSEQMMRDMGSAAWFVIDTNEDFQFAKGADTNGDVYKNLIQLCNNENSLLISGAVIGQDTVNGNRAKEESSQKLFDKLLQSDRRNLTLCWNEKVIPALQKMGILPAGCFFELQQEEDLDKLWAIVKDVLPYKNVPNDWLEDKFGIKVEDKQESSKQLSVSNNDFFD